MRRGIDGELKDEYCCPTGDGERDAEEVSEGMRRQRNGI